MTDDLQQRQLSVDGSVHVTDEKFNAASHLCGAIFALLGGIILVVMASMAGKPWHIVSYAIYGMSLFTLFCASTLHHSVMTSEKTIRILRILDYNSIFLLIAGTYTPVCLVAVRNGLGWSTLGVCWAVAIFGIILRSSIQSLPKWFTQTLYVSMGWLGVAIALPFYEALGKTAFYQLIGGGLFYSVGSIIFIVEKPNPIPGKFGFHEIWHLFVLAGAGAHFAMMLEIMSLS